MTPPDTDGGGPIDPDGAVVGPGQPNPVAVALRGLAPAEHLPTFWDELDHRLADEPQLRLAPRAAIRPITQPPPVIDDRKLAEHVAEPRPRAGGWKPVRLLAWGVAIVVTAVLIAAVLYDPDGETPAGDPDDTATAAATAGTSQSTTTTAPPTTTTAPGVVDASAPLAPDGVGPLRINTSYGDLQAAGVALTVDQATFDGSGGSCYDAVSQAPSTWCSAFAAPCSARGSTNLRTACWRRSASKRGCRRTGQATRASASGHPRTRCSRPTPGTSRTTATRTRPAAMCSSPRPGRTPAWPSPT